MKLEVDPEFASLIPPLTAEEYMQLEANIVAEGCRDPVVAWGSIVIDGHNRLRICTKHDISYQVVQRDFEGRDDALVYIIRNQFGRRNLSSGNRCLLALKLEPLYRLKAKENQQQSLGRGKKGVQKSAHLFPTGKTRENLAKIAGVSHNTMDKVKQIVEQGTPEQVDRIKRGGKGDNITAVFREVRAAADPVPDSTKPPISSAIPEDTAQQEPLQQAEMTREDELEQIRRYVADLKNPDLNRAYTTEMFMVEYEAFVERFTRSLGVFIGAPYSGVYPLLSVEEKEMLSALNTTMSREIRKLNTLMKG